MLFEGQLYNIYNMRGTPKNRNLFIKNCVFILTPLNFSHLQSTFHFMQYTYWDVFSTAQNSFWTHWFWSLLVLLPFHLFHLGKMFPFEDIFHLGKKTNKKVTWGKIGWIERVGPKGHVVLGQKLLNTQLSVGRCAHKSPIMKWGNTLKESLKKNSLKLNVASHNNASWYTDTDGFLEHLLSGRSLYYKGITLHR